MENDDSLRSVVWDVALENSVRYGGQADLMSVLGRIMKEHPEYRQSSAQVKEIIESLITEIGQMSLEEQNQKLLEFNPEFAPHEKKRGPEKKVLPDLSNVTGEVVMRMAPYPSGALHIGNARMIVLNDEYVKRYGGKLILFYDDTIGTTKAGLEGDPDAKFILPESYDLIDEGLDWLGVQVHERYWKSDRVDLYQEYAKQLLERGEAYVCTCDAEEFRERYKKPGIDCPDRDLAVEENLARWDQMLDGSYAEGAAVVRLKTGMQNKNPAIRDHIIMRISDAPHPRIGDKCRVWPLMDFSQGIDDYLIGITHIIRGTDLAKEGEIERIFWQMMGWPDKEIILYGKLSFGKEFKLSKTFQRKMIEDGTYVGWNDPRTWSLQSLAARGIQPDALRQALLDLGLSKNAINFDKAWVYAKNTKLIDTSSDRIFFVQNPVSMHVTGIPFEELVAKPLINPSLPDKGNREIPVTISNGELDLCVAKSDVFGESEVTGGHAAAIEIGSNVRLKDLFTVTISGIDGEITSEFYKKELEDHKEMRKIQWVDFTNNIPVKILQPDGVFTTGLAESNLALMAEGSFAQFERHGYVRVIKKEGDNILCYFIN